MSALYLASIGITAVVIIRPSEVAGIKRTGKFQDGPILVVSWPRVFGTGSAEASAKVLSENLPCLLRQFKVICWHFVALFKEVRTGNKRLLFAVDGFWAGYTPNLLSVFFKGIIQRMSRNLLFQSLFYDTRVTLRFAAYCPSTVNAPAEANGIPEAWAMAGSLQVRCGRGSCSSSLCSVLLAIWD